MSVTAQYAAGFFDGEGCVYIRRIQAPSNYKGRTYYRVESYIGNCDTRPLQALATKYGGKVYETNARKVREKDWSRQFRWCLSCTSAVNFLRDIAPYCLIKQSYINLALEFAEVIGEGCVRNEERQAELFARYQEMRSKETRTRHFNKK